MVKLNNKNIVKIYKNIPEFLLDGDTKDNNIDELCADLSKMKFKKKNNTIIHSLKIKSNINKCKKIVTFRKEPIFCFIKK